MKECTEGILYALFMCLPPFSAFRNSFFPSLISLASSVAEPEPEPRQTTKYSLLEPEQRHNSYIFNLCTILKSQRIEAGVASFFFPRAGAASHQQDSALQPCLQGMFDEKSQSSELGWR
jgi:hypothetical protein